MARQNVGKETWLRLREWQKGQTASERLAAQILIEEGFLSVDPSHPLGGRDGLKDVVCVKDGKKWIACVHFPNGEVHFREVKKKFKADLQGCKKNNAFGIIFVTNQEIKLADRDILKEIAGEYQTEIYHLERIAALLNSPRYYGIRLEFLDIEMTKEDQLAYMAAKDAMILDLKNIVVQIMSEMKKHSKDIAIPKVEVTPDTDLYSSYSLLAKRFHKCSYCGYGYKIRAGSNMIYAISNQTTITCPKCGNTEQYASYL